MKPFENNCDAVSIGNLSIENGVDEIVFHGDLVLGKDALSRERLAKLQALLLEIDRKLSAAPLDEAPTDTPASGDVDEVDNPFLS